MFQCLFMQVFVLTQSRGFVQGRNKHGARRDLYYHEEEIFDKLFSQKSFFIWRIWFLTLPWAVSQHLVPQTGITKLIFLKDDYCIQFKCSKYLTWLICFLEPRTGAVTLKKEWKSKLDNSNLASIYLKVFRTALSSDFTAKVNIWFGTWPQNSEQKRPHVFIYHCCIIK